MNLEHIKDRLADYNGRYQDNRPKWNNADYASIWNLLTAFEDMHATLTLIADKGLTEYDRATIGNITRQCLVRTADNLGLPEPGPFGL